MEGKLKTLTIAKCIPLYFDSTDACFSDTQDFAVFASYISPPCVQQIRATGRADTSLQAVTERYSRMIAAAPSEPTPQLGRLIGMAAHLGALRICLCDGGAARWRMRLALNVPAEDAIYVLKCDT
jgi:hypothetical protein